MPTRYITGATNASVKAIAGTVYDLPLLLTPDSAKVRTVKSKDGPAGMPGAYANAKNLDVHTEIALDNGGYGAKGAEFIYGPTKWIDWIVGMRLLLDERAAAGKTNEVLWATVPDKLDWYPVPDPRPGMPTEFCVTDAPETLRMARAFAPFVRWLGFKVAMVAGDGMENMIDEIPWELLDCIFLGGSTEWKIGYGGERVAKEAKARGKLVHMGRVSSLERMEIADRFGCDTADGTYLKAGPETNLPKVMEWLDALNNREPDPIYYPAKAISLRREAEGKARRKAKKARSLAAKKAAKTRAANKARAATMTRKAA